MNERNAIARGLSEAYMDGAVSIPYALLRTYRSLKLSDTEAMLLIQLLAYRQLEQNEFPTMEQLQERLGCTATVVGQTIQKLVKQGFVTIDEMFDAATGMQSERYNLQGLFHKIGALLATGELPLRASGEARAESPTGEPDDAGYFAQSGAALKRHPAGAQMNVFTLFEQEFGRPLSPMEVETINGWLDQDRYPDELIRLALKESVFNGKLHFRYIDRILLDWNRNGIHTVEQARAQMQKFRSVK
jgi:DNA replication protein